ncbi:MAG: hypothetical protein ABI665_12275 [Vicinamibacterales bacterium]
MTLRFASRAASIAAIMTLVACGGSSPAPATPQPATTAPAAAAPAPATATLALLEPAEGAFSGHVDTFRWSPAQGADAYRVKISTASGRVVWESPALTVAEAHLPATVSLEPEAHVWQVTAMKGADVLVTSTTGRFTVTP